MTINRSTSFLSTSNHAQTSKLSILSKRSVPPFQKEYLRKGSFLSYIWAWWILSLILDSWPSFLKWAYLNENKQVKRDQLLDQNCFNQIYFFQSIKWRKIRSMIIHKGELLSRNIIMNHYLTFNDKNDLNRLEQSDTYI